MLWFLLVPMFSSIRAQIVQPLPITDQERAYHRSVYDLKKDIEFSASMAAIVDSVYPGVRFIMQASSIGHRGFIYYIKEKDTTNFYITDGELQLDCTFLYDSVFRYSVSSLLKTDVYLDLIRRLGKKYFNSGLVLESDQIEVTKVSIDLNDNKDRRYRAMDSSERFINYTVNVNLPETFIFNTGNGQVQTKSIYYEYTVVEGLIIGRAVTFLIDDGSMIKQDYYGYRKFNLKYEKRNYKQYRELKK
jgi:glycosidase